MDESEYSDYEGVAPYKGRVRKERLFWIPQAKPDKQVQRLLKLAVEGSAAVRIAARYLLREHQHLIRWERDGEVLIGKGR